MFNRFLVSDVIDAAIQKYAEDNDGKTGIAKKDVIRAVNKYGGDESVVNMVMLEAMRRLAPDKQILS